MTLIIALKWLDPRGEAVLVSSDSKVTTSIGITYEDRKLYPILWEGKPVAVAGGSGDVPLVKWGFEKAEEVLQRYAQKEYPVKFISFKNAVREIENAFIERLNQLRDLEVESGFQMILCGLDIDSKASMYYFNSTGLAEPVHDNPGFAIIGKGFITGGILLLNLLGYTVSMDLGLLTTFILDSVSEIDTAVGPFVGESYLMRIEKKKGKKGIVLGSLKDEAINEFKEKAAKRKNMIRLLWNLCDEVGENKVNRVLNSLKNKSK